MIKTVIEWMHDPRIYRILASFLVPKTPRQVEKELGIKKLKMKPFLEKQVLKCLNPEARKGRLYILTHKARSHLELPSLKNRHNRDWNLIGWVVSSPRQRYVVLKTIAIDSVKRTSEQIRMRAKRLNSCLSRISTKAILNELVDKGLVGTKMEDDLRRYYWIRPTGLSLEKELSCFHHDM